MNTYNNQNIYKLIDDNRHQSRRVTKALCLTPAILTYSSVHGRSISLMSSSSHAHAETVRFYL